MASDVRVLVDATTGTNTGTAANRAIKNDEPDTRQRVVGLDDWCGVPTGTSSEGWVVTAGGVTHRAVAD